MRNSELAGLVCARICHDLASPVGAVVNGAEMMREIAGQDSSQELSLVEQSAQRAAALIQFHRLAFGIHRDPEALISRQQLRSRIAPILETPRISLAWNVAEGGDISIAAGQLIGLMLLATKAMLGPSGTLTLLLPPGGALPAAVMADGAKSAASPEQRGWLRGTSDAVPDSRQVEFSLLPAAAAAAGARLELIEDTGRLALRALPA